MTVDREIGYVLRNYPEWFCAKINKDLLVMKILDPTTSIIIYRLFDIQIEMEKCLILRRSNLIERYYMNLDTLKMSNQDAKSLNWLRDEFKKNLLANDLDIVSEVDRMVSVQLEFLRVLGVPGFHETQHEDGELTQQKLLNDIYHTIAVYIVKQ